MQFKLNTKNNRMSSVQSAIFLKLSYMHKYINDDHYPSDSVDFFKKLWLLIHACR